MPVTTLTLAPSSPLNLGNITVAEAFNFVLTFMATGGSVTVSNITFSDTTIVAASPLPFTLNPPATPSTVFSFTVTPTALGADSVTITVINNTTQAAITYVVNYTAVNAGSGVVTVVSESPATLAPGQAPTTVINQTNTYGVGLYNGGSTSVTIDTAAISEGSPTFTLAASGQPTLPYTLNAGDTVYFPVVFAPTESGLQTGQLDFTTSLSPSPGTILANLEGLCVPFIPVSVVSDSIRQIIIGYQTNPNVSTGIIQGLLQTVENFNVDAVSTLIFNGTLWNSPGMEKTLERLMIYYENIGACLGLILNVITFRPSLGSDYFQVVTATVNLGTAAADNTDRSAYIDLQASGEIMILQIIRPAGAGACSITGIIPSFADRGEKVENV
jgi:hypothetical protein